MMISTKILNESYSNLVTSLWNGFLEHIHDKTWDDKRSSSVSLNVKARMIYSHRIDVRMCHLYRDPKYKL